MSKKKRLVLLDTHAILHRSFHGMPEFRASSGEPTGALYGLSVMLFSIIKDLNPDYIAACYDVPEPTFRDELFEEYKAGREGPDDALISQIDRSHDVFEAFNVPVYAEAGFEADDLLGTIVEQTKGNKDLEIIVASGDNDTLSLTTDPRVKVYTLRKGFNDTVLYDKKAVKEKFGFGPELLADYKALRGDPSDNIPGVAGVGEKTATELLTKIGELDKIYDTLEKKPDSFEKKGFKPRVVKLLSEQKEQAYFSKVLATIRNDATIKYELPKDHWVESIPAAKVKQLFSELEFRSLVARLSELSKEEKEEEKEEKPVDQDELLEAGLALWVLNSDFHDPDLEAIAKYTKENDLSKAKKKLLAELKEKDLLDIYQKMELPLVSVLKRAEDRGVLVDSGYLKELSKKYHKELSTHEKKIYKYAEGEFNIASPKQLGEVLFEKLGLKPPKKTSTGQPSTNAAVLEKLKGEHPIIDEILAYRGLAKLLSTYIDNIPEMLDKDNRLHTTFVQTGTTTGRLSSRDPNMQNIPIRSEHGRAIRSAFLATPGFKLVAFDYSQIDLRALALLSNDERLIDAFSSGRDIHEEVANELFGNDDSIDEREKRRRAKVINFGIVYGMGVNALRANLGVPRKEAEQFHNAYFESFPGVTEFLDKTKDIAHDRGYTETYFGRRRYYAGLRSPLEYVQKMAERAAANAPIQGTAADIIKIATIEIDRMIDGDKLRGKAELLLQIHDELIYEIEEGIAQKVSEKIKDIMEGVVDNKVVEFPVKVRGGKSWGDL